MMIRLIPLLALTLAFAQPAEARGHHHRLPPPSAESSAPNPFASASAEKAGQAATPAKAKPAAVPAGAGALSRQMAS